MSEASRVGIPSSPWRHDRGAAWLVLALSIMLVAIGCGGGDPGFEVADLQEVPRPDLADFEPVVRGQLEASRQKLDALIAGEAAGAGELAAAFGVTGKLYHAYNLLETAAPCYRNALTIQPDDAVSAYLLAYLQQTRGEVEPAIESFRRSLEIEPEQLSGWVRLGNAYRDANRPEEAAEAFRRALEIDEEVAAIHYGLGEARALAGDDEGAVRSFERALEIDPSATRVRYPLGQAYRRLGRIEEARRFVSRSGGQELEFPDPLIAELESLARGSAAFLARGNLAAFEGDPAEQIAQYRAAVAAAPEDAMAQDSLGFALARAGELEEALEHLTEAVRLAPDNGEIRHHRGRLLAAAGRSDEARTELEAALELIPGLVEARLDLAGIHAFAERFDEALAQLDAILAEQPDNSGIRGRKGELLLAIERYAEAEELLRRLAEDEPDNAMARMSLSKALASQGRWDEAIAVLDEVADSDADAAVRASALAARGAARTRQGRIDEAIADLRRAIEVRADQTQARFQLANLLGQRGEYGAAAEQYLQVVAVQPAHHAARLGGATALALAGRPAEAKDLLEDGMALPQPDPRVALVLAQLLATAPDAELRDPQRAVELAGELFRRQQTLEHGETLAVALAGIGRFDEARKLQQSLLEAVGTDAPPEVRARLAERSRELPSRRGRDAGRRLSMSAGRLTGLHAVGPRRKGCRSGGPRSADRGRYAVLVGLLIAAAGCGDGGRGGPTDAPAGPESEVFTDVAAASGIDFVHFNGMSGEHYFAEMMGGGGALFDYDNDGDLDIYLVQGAMLGADQTVADATFPPRHPLPLTDRLYRNDLEVRGDGSRVLRFADVTERAGIAAHGYGMGVAAGDVDNDGWLDLYVTNFGGGNQLWRNRGDGTFVDATAGSGAEENRWSVAAAMLDYDRDGWLDLYVGNYVDYTLGGHKRCFEKTGFETYCGPLTYHPEADRLLRNRGDGTFADATTSLIGAEAGSTLGVVTGDFDADGWLDLYVALDAMPNRLWINQRDSSFRNLGLLSGAAVNRQGGPEGSMGVTAGDFDNDGDEDLLMTHIDLESNTVYRNDGAGLFEDVSMPTGLGMSSWKYTGFGASWFDFDNDGWLDVMVVNGAVYDLEELVEVGDPFPLHQPNLLFRNTGDGAFADLSGTTAGEIFRLPEVSRGAAFGDIDNDGDPDVLVVNNNGPARLLRNNAGSANRWIGVGLQAGAGRAEPLGSWLRLRCDDGPSLWRRTRRDGSYAVANDSRVVGGLGDCAAPVEVLHRLTDGRSRGWRELAADRYAIVPWGGGSG